MSRSANRVAVEALATVRAEMPPGRQVQIDLGQRQIAVEGWDPGKVYLFVATLGCSRWIYTQAFQNERQSACLEVIAVAVRQLGACPASCCSTTFARWSSITARMPRPIRQALEARSHDVRVRF